MGAVIGAFEVRDDIGTFGHSFDVVFGIDQYRNARLATYFFYLFAAEPKHRNVVGLILEAEFVEFPFDGSAVRTAPKSVEFEHE